MASAREPDMRTMAAVGIAIDTARATVADCRHAADAGGPAPRSAPKPRLQVAGVSEP